MDDVTNATAQQLKSFVERIERLEEDKKNISDDISEVFSEAKGNGFDSKILRKIIALRKLDEDDRKEEEEIMTVYMEALGMI